MLTPLARLASVRTPKGPKLSRDIATMFGSQSVAVVAQITTMAVAARILLPHAVGVYTASVTVIGALTFAGDLQIYASAVRATGDHRRLARTAAGLSLALGLVYAVLILLLGPWVAGLLELSESGATLLPIVRIAALGPIIIALGAAPATLLARRLRLADLALGQLALAVSAAVSTIALALWLRSPWALALGTLIGQLTQLAVLLHATHAELGSVARAERSQPTMMRPFLRFGGTGFVLALLTFLGTNADNLTVARLFGATTLGAYALAYSLARSVDGSISSVVTRVLFPTLASDLRDGNRACLVSTVPRVLSAVAAASCVVEGLIFLTAPILVPHLFGPAWASVTIILQVLVLDGLWAPVVNILGNALLSAGMIRQVLGYVLVHVVLMLAALMILPVHLGIVGVAASEVIGGGGATLTVCCLYARYTGLPLRALVSGTLPWAATLLATLGCYLGVRGITSAIGWSVHSTVLASAAGAILLALSTLFAGRRTHAVSATDARLGSTVGAV